MNNSSIDNFFNGNVSGKEREKILEWMKSKDAEKEVEEHIREYFKRNSDKKIIWNSEEALLKLKSKLELVDQKSDAVIREANLSTTGTADDRRHSGTAFYKVFLTSAAVILIFIASVIVFRHLKQQYFDSTELTTADISRVTEKGQKLSIYLSDGSKVILNSGSRISYPTEFEADTRRIVLEGEAFFEITKNPDKPFIVQTGTYETVVLGTSFVVNAKPDNESISVALKSGKVLVRQKHTKDKSSSAPDKVHLTPGEMLTINKVTGSNDITNFDEVSVFGWTRNILDFKEDKLKNVFRRLENWYDVKFIFNQEYEKKKNTLYSGRFENESLENVLVGLSYINDFEFDIEGKIVKINFK